MSGYGVRPENAASAAKGQSYLNKMAQQEKMRLYYIEEAKRIAERKAEREAEEERIRKRHSYGNLGEDPGTEYSTDFERQIYGARGNSINRANRLAAEEAAAAAAIVAAREKARRNTANKKKSLYSGSFAHLTRPVGGPVGGRRTQKHRKSRKHRRSHRHRKTRSS